MATTAENPDIHICIVGAGIAGLQCANVLLERSVRVTILEARDRIGGRICQSDGLGYSVDLGPQWIHTSGHNPLLQLAKETNTPLHTWNDINNLYDEDGTLLEKSRGDRIFDLVWQIIGEALDFSRENGVHIPESLSLFDFFKRRAKEIFPGQNEDQRALLNLCQMWGAYVGHPVTKQSLRFARLESCCVGDEVILTGTYEAILNRIARRPLASANLKFNKRVVGIEAAEDAREQRQLVTLRTDDGETQSYDEVILTIPLGWLKRRHQEAFSPALPTRLSQAIENISVGHLEKVFITFPKAFWTTTTVPTDTTDTTDTTDSDTAAAAAEVDNTPGYFNFFAPNYSTEHNPHRWPQEAYNLAAYAAPNKHPTLLFYLYGDCAQHVVNLSVATATVATAAPAAAPAAPAAPAHADGEGGSTLTLHPSGPGTTHPLYPFFAPYIAKLPNYKPDAPDCVPTRILNTTWQLDELAGNGSYINYQVPIEDAEADMRCLRDGVGAKRKVWFAGEHTSPPEESGTATGAYLAGEEVAGRILKIRGIIE
ncbi:MAG: hypothetical protein M1825_000755 [Sarcosagium campestre]|nr:MAG: hypothetical protein M1825_000755 [Sarcosagium campestre]